MKLRDIFLLPKDFYKKLNDNRLALYIGILLVGLRNTGFYLWSRQDAFAPASIQDVLLRNTAVLAGFVILIGIMDVIFFSYPIYDILKFLKKREENPGAKVSVIRLMKVYILANLMVTPVDLILSAAGSYFGDKNVNAFIGIVLAIIALLNFFWYFAIIARGAASLFSFKGGMVVFIFITAFLYNELLNYAYKFIYEKGLMVLLK